MKTLSIIAALLLTATAAQATNSNTELIRNNDPLTEISTPNLTPLCLAAAKGDVDGVKKLIELGADVNATSRGLTPLMFAARYNHCQIIKVLLKEGAKADTRDLRLKKTAYEYAELSNAEQAMAILKNS